MNVVACPSCSKQLQYNPQQAGKQVRCPACQTVILLPGAPNPTPPADPLMGAPMPMQQQQAGLQPGMYGNQANPGYSQGHGTAPKKAAKSNSKKNLILWSSVGGGVLLIIIICVIAFRPGTTDKTAENNKGDNNSKQNNAGATNDSSGKNQNQNTGDANVSQTIDPLGSLQAAKITFSDETGLPSDYLIPDYLTFEKIGTSEDFYGFAMKSEVQGAIFTSTERFPKLLAFQEKNGWKRTPPLAVLYKYDRQFTPEEYLKMYPNDFPSEARVYSSLTKKLDNGKWRFFIYLIQDPLNPKIQKQKIRSDK